MLNFNKITEYIQNKNINVNTIYRYNNFKEMRIRF